MHCFLFNSFEKKQSSFNMERIAVDDPSIQHQVCSFLRNTLVAENEVRQHAEQQLKSFETCVDQQQGYLHLLMIILSDHSLSPDLRQAASIKFKNTIKESWNAVTSDHIVNDADKHLVRENIFGVMLASPKYVQKTLCEAISIIASTDFPAEWPMLLSTLADRLDPSVQLVDVASSLTTAHSIFLRYRKAEQLTEQLRSELLEINARLTIPLLHVMERCAAEMNVQSPKQSVEAAVVAFTAATDVFLDVTYLDLGQEHENNMNQFMTALLYALKFKDNRVDDLTFEGPLIDMKTTILSCVALHLQKYDEEFEPYVRAFTEDAWYLLR